MPSLPCLLLFLLPLVAAYKETVPVVAWTSHYSSKLDSLANRPEPFTESSQFFDAILNGAELCNYDAVVIVDQPGLHATDLRALSKSSHLSQKLSQTKSIQIPYLPYSSGSDSLDVFKDVIAKRCGARRVELELGQGGITFHEGERHVVVVNMPSLEDEYGPFGRGETLSHCDKQLHHDISNVASVFPSHIVIYTSSRPFTKRQAGEEPSESVSLPIIENAAAPFNSTLAKGSLVQRYRFFTPGLITAFLIVFGILVPLLMFGIYALASIQSPVRMDAPKGPSLEKKHQ